jgi:hypothetical protein
LRRSIVLANDRSRHNREARLDGRTMRKLQANDDGVIGKERVVHSDQDLTKMDSTINQCQLLCTQMAADCSKLQQQYGGMCTAHAPNAKLHVCCAGLATSLIRKLPPLPNSASKFPRFVGPYHEYRLKLASIKARKRNFKKVTLQRRYNEILERSSRYRNRDRNWQHMGNSVGVSQPAGYQAGRQRPSTSSRIAQNAMRAVNNRPALHNRNRGHRPNICRPANRND